MVFEWRKTELAATPRVDRSDVRERASEYVQEVQSTEDWKLSTAHIEVVCTQREENEIAAFMMPMNTVNRMPYDDYAIIKVIPTFIDKYGFDWYVPAIRHELAHIETALRYGEHREDSAVFRDMLDAFDAPLNYKELTITVNHDD